MSKLWHPMFKELSIERDEAEVAAYVAAGWLKNKSTRKVQQVLEPDETNKEAEKKSANEPDKADATSPATDEA